jgi:apolipoprotein N-acyltransferase
MEVLLVATAGYLQTVAYGADDLWWLQGLGVAVLAWRVAPMTWGRAAWLGWVFSVAWLSGSFWWLYISMHQYGGLQSWMAVAAVLALAGGLSLFLALAMGVFAAWHRGRLVMDACLFAACWLLAELARGTFLTGFPWASSGYAHLESPLIALAPWVGVYGVGAVAALLAALSVFSFTGAYSERPAWAVLALATLALLLLGLWGGGFYTRPAQTVRVTLLQPNVPQDDKFSAAMMPQTLAWMARQLVHAEGDLVVAPETALPMLPEELPTDYWAHLQRHFSAPGNAALIGMPLGNAVQGYTNSVVGLSASKAGPTPDSAYRYNKHHLVPFGEFIPNGFHWFTAMMRIPLGDFLQGPLSAPAFELKMPTGIVRVAPNICYEDLFGEELAAWFVDEARAPGILANLSNVAWFGNTVAVPQHLQISRMRSMEFQRPMIRATNTGATVVIDHTGRVTDRMAFFTRGSLDAVVQARNGLTPFARWSSHWHLRPLWGLGVLTLLICRRWRHPKSVGART